MCALSWPELGTAQTTYALDIFLKQRDFILTLQIFTIWSICELFQHISLWTDHSLQLWQHSFRGEYCLVAVIQIKSISLSRQSVPKTQGRHVAAQQHKHQICSGLNVTRQQLGDLILLGTCASDFYPNTGIHLIVISHLQQWDYNHFV